MAGPIACIARNLHNVSLALKLADNGHMEGEWFCQGFKDNGKSNSAAVEHLKMVFAELHPSVLYRFRTFRGPLDEIPMASIEQYAA